MRYLAIIVVIGIVLSSCTSRQNGGGKLDPTYLSTVTISQMELVNPSGQPWDNDGSGPDIVVGLYRGESEVEDLMTPVKYNVKQVDLPVEWNVSSRRVPMSGNTWTIRLYDQDDNNRTLMHSWKVAPTLEENTLTLMGQTGQVYTIILEFDR